MTAQPPIEVLSYSSTGLPAKFPHVGHSGTRAMMAKAATRVEYPADLIRMGEDLFGCGLPDVTVSYRYRGASETEVRELTLVRQQRREGQDQLAPSPSACLPSCQPQ